MNTYLKIFLIITLFVFENIGLWFVTDFYAQSKAYSKILEANKGVAVACQNVKISDDLFSVLQQLNQYHPVINIKSNQIYVSYGVELLGGAGTALIFDKNFRLINKGCDSDWEPQVPNFIN